MNTLMKAVDISSQFDADFLRNVELESEQKLNRCYQCGKCTAGCPFSFAYDVPVNQIMRFVQAGQKEAALNCKSIWLCATCKTCTARCPNNIDVARVMDVLRHIARRENRVGVDRVRKFWDSFLASVQANGRLFETGVMAGYMAKTGRVWTDMDLGPRIAPKGKLSLWPHKVRGQAEISRIFERFNKGTGA